MTACVRFPWRAVVTTAFDDLWEQALDAADGGRRPPAVMTAERQSGAGAIVRTTAAAHRRTRVAAREPLPRPGRRARPPGAVAGDGVARAHGAPPLAGVRGFRPTDPNLVWLSSWLSTRPSDVPHFLFLDVSSDPDADTEVAVWGLRTGFDVIPCPEGTAEGVERLAVIATSIAAQLPPLDTDIDIGIWLDKWAQDPGNPQPREVLARVETALRDDERWDRRSSSCCGGWISRKTRTTSWRRCATWRASSATSWARRRAR